MPQSKVRIYELSKMLDVSNKAVLDVLSAQFNLTLKSHSSSIDRALANKVAQHFRQGGSSQAVVSASVKTAAGSPASVVTSAPVSAATAVAVKPVNTPPASPSSSSHQGLSVTPVTTSPTTPTAPSSSKVASSAPSVQSSSPQAVSAQRPASAAGVSTGQPQGRPGMGGGAAMVNRPVSVGPRPAGASSAPVNRAPESLRSTSGHSQAARPAGATGGGYAPGQRPPAQRPPLGNTPPIRVGPRPPGSAAPGGPASSSSSMGGARPSSGGMSQQQEYRRPSPQQSSDRYPSRSGSGGGHPGGYGGGGYNRPGGGSSSSARPGGANRPGGGREGAFRDGNRSASAGGAPVRGDRRPGGAATSGHGGGGRPGGAAGGSSVGGSSSSVAPLRPDLIEQPSGRSEGRRRPGEVPRRPDPAERLEQERWKDDVDAAIAARAQKGKDAVAVADAPKEPVLVSGPMTLREFAAQTHLRETEIIKHLFMKGMMVTVNHSLDEEVLVSLGEAFEIPVEVKKQKDMSQVETVSILHRATQEKDEDVDQARLVSRAPVISIMGHVDHGKTSLLDAIREVRQRIVDTEAGGITQSIGAYTVEKDGANIVFLDTPGHEAFTSMRMRGAQATDIAILVVAADDGVMPQTIEAINHAKAAGIPIIVAINKVDKEGADPFRVQSELMEHGLVAENLGGETPTVEVSALQKLGIDDLLEMIVLVSELQELKADPTGEAQGVVIEARLDKRMGPVATVLVQKGTLSVGDNVLMGAAGGRVRALIDDQNQRIQSAGPATPVEILGLNDVPNAGELFTVIDNDKLFKSRLQEERQRVNEERLATRSRMVGGLSVSMDDENKKELRLILKADSQGAVEAALQAIQQLETDEVGVNILHTGTGDITEADVMLASASQAIIVGFNVREDNNAVRIREHEDVPVHNFDVIYHMVERVRQIMLGQLDAEIHEVEVGQAEVRQLFTIGRDKVVAGCMVVQGKVVRSGKAAVVRGGKTVYEGSLDVLRRFKDDVKEVAQGYECGISFQKFNDLQEGDRITCTVQELRQRTSL